MQGRRIYLKKKGYVSELKNKQTKNQQDFQIKCYRHYFTGNRKPKQNVMWQFVANAFKPIMSKNGQ